MIKIEPYIERFVLTPRDHQIVGVERLINMPYFALFDEMGSGKTKHVIDTVCILFVENLIDRVIVFAPAPVRGVWSHPELGEIKKHLWPEIPAWITEYHARRTRWEQKGIVRKDPRILRWIITNYDFIRSDERRLPILQLASKRTLFVLDESSAIKNPNAIQTKASKQVRLRCGRIIELNGTPISNNPGDLFSQMDLLSPTILGVKNYYHFRARYAKMGGWQGKQIVDWHDLDDLNRRIGPYVLRRLKKDCLDLPEKLPSVPIVPNLTPRSWQIYKQMRDDMVAWLSSDTMATAQQAIVRIMRLSQITSGFVGGVEQGDIDFSEAAAEVNGIEAEPKIKRGLVEEIGREKLDITLALIDTLLEQEPNIKILIWSRFRAEVNRLVNELEAQKRFEVGKIWGGQKEVERNRAKQLLDPRTAPPGPAIVVGTAQTGGLGLNLVASHTVIYMSNDYSLKTRLQSEDRVHRQGQTEPVSYFDLIAEGPNGQKTIDHIIQKALRTKQNLADLTTMGWISVLTEDAA